MSDAAPVAYQIQIYPRDNVWDPVKLEPFVSAIRGVDPAVTGSPVQIYESGLLMERSYRFAGVLAILVVLVLAYLDFQGAARSAAGLVLLVVTGAGAMVAAWWGWW